MKTYAHVAWAVEDVHEIRRERMDMIRELYPDLEGSDWTDEQCEEFLSRVEKQVQEAMTATGCENLETYMAREILNAAKPTKGA